MSFELASSYSAYSSSIAMMMDVGKVASPKCLQGIQCVLDGCYYERDNEGSNVSNKRNEQKKFVINVKSCVWQIGDPFYRKESGANSKY